MNKQFKLFFCFLAVLILPALCQASTTILSNASPNHTVTSGSDEQVYGTSASNQIVLESGAKAELINFPGHNSIQIQSGLNLFTVSRSGTIVTFQDDSGTLLRIPATTDPQTIEFADQEPLTLSIHNGQVMLDDQVITTTAAAIDGFEALDDCGAYVAPGIWKEFDCYNLAAIGKTTNDDPFTPSWRLIGGYWQWGRKGPDSSLWYNTNTEHFAHGPTGPGTSEANDGDIAEWDSSYALDGAWSDTSKTANDPCPDGFRVPTKSQWMGVVDNNTPSTVGWWSRSATNYSSARFFGSELMLPTAGTRYRGNGALDGGLRGNSGAYWSSSDSRMNEASYLYFSSSDASTYWPFSRLLGQSVRCIAEDSSQPQALSLGKKRISLDFGDSESISISGGTGHYTVSTSNSQVATAVIYGNSIEITGLSSGTATITVSDTDGGTASISVTVPSDICGAYVAPDVWKEFDCYNLGAIGKTTGDDPFTPSWQLIGGYWQWGRKGPDSSLWYDTNTEHFAHGPTGPGAGEANSGSLSEWDQTYAPDESWSDTYKTVNDPCPEGFRVPTKSQWMGVVDNNTPSRTGIWEHNATNYSSARFFGNDLMLLAAGNRSYNGASRTRGYYGLYWSSSEYGSYSAWYLYFSSGTADTHSGDRGDGQSVRCVAE